MNKTACTSKLCEWKKSRKRAYPAPLHTINFKRPKKEDNIPQIDEPFTETLQGFCRADPVKFCNEAQRQQLKSLKQHTPDAAVLTCVSLKLNSEDDFSSGEETGTCSETEETTLPELLTSFFDPCSANYTKEKITQIGQNKYEQHVKNATWKQYNNLTKITNEQSVSNKWMLYRAGRITSSNCKKAFTMDLKHPASSTVKSIMQYNNVNITTQGMKYGKESEPKAFKQFHEDMEVKHTNFTVENTGLHVNEKFPYIGASPDGLTNCDCHGKGVLEIKCPFTFKKGLSGYKDSKTCPITSDEKFKENHEYYFQVQLQMLVTERDHCDFFVWSKNDWIMVHVVKNENFCEALKVKLKKVFMEVILPELVTRNDDPANEKQNKLYCYCNRPSFQPMIACDSVTCKHEWFHFACANVLRTPSENKKWFCPDCSKKIKKF